MLMWNMTNIDKLREELYAWCGRNAACRRAADYYIALLQNPCYPPDAKSTANMLKFYMEIIEKYGRPHKCDIKKLAEERLRGTPLEKHADEAAELAERLRRRCGMTSRVAAAVATVIVARAHGIPLSYAYAAALFGVSTASVVAQYRRAVSILQCSR
jgi:hypothetical protein